MAATAVNSSDTNIPAIEYRRLGKSGLRVSVPTLGAMSFGDPKWGGWPINEEEAIPLLKHAWERGMNTWDTANIYSDGESERIIGKAIKQLNIPRHKLIILTKCFFLVHPNAGSDPNLSNTRDCVNQSGLSRASIFNQVADSLERLDTSYIDLLQIHRWDPDAEPEEVMEALHDLVKSGKVRYIGASSMWTWQFQLLNNIAEKKGWTKFISMQNRYSLIYREEEREMNAYCSFAGIGLIPWGPLHAGFLARPASTLTNNSSTNRMSTMPPELRGILKSDEEIITRVEKVANDNGWTMAEVALSWIGEKVTSPIVGVSSPKRLDEAVVTGKKLTEEQAKYLEEPYELHKIVGHL